MSEKERARNVTNCYAQMINGNWPIRKEVNDWDGEKLPIIKSLFIAHFQFIKMTFDTTELLIGPIFLFQVLPDIQTCQDSELFVISCFRDM